MERISLVNWVYLNADGFNDFQSNWIPVIVEKLVEISDDAVMYFKSCWLTKEKLKNGICEENDSDFLKYTEMFEIL